jgi:predicted metallo-beta-lactamase superfamily hydrolase
LKIEILAAESLGVRGLCCFIKTKRRKILIDPGIALGYMRNKLLPHPAQIAVDERIKKKIIHAWSEATDIVISHFHGDHVPLAEANPYQLDINRLRDLNKNVRIWSKNPERFSPTEKNRAAALSSILNLSIRTAEGKKDGPLVFSEAVPHGEANSPDTVMMTRIEDDGIFVHASDIQLLDTNTVSRVIDWKPDIVLAGGPPIYLPWLTPDQIGKARENALRISQAIQKVILDHHLIRSVEGFKWLRHLTFETGNVVICAADFMKFSPHLLEANRAHLYDIMPVPDGWHDNYATGKVSTEFYWVTAKKFQVI